MAKERVGKAVLEIELDGTKFFGGLDTVEARVSRMPRTFESASGQIRGIGANLEQFLAKMGAGFERAQTGQDGFTRAVERFSGIGVVGEANAYLKAIEAIGGVSALTASEQANVNRTVTEAIEKYRALGQDAPPALVDLAEATRQVEEPTEQATLSVGKLVASYVTAEAIIGAVKAAWSSYIGLIGSSVESYASAESAQVKLVAALRSQGNATPGVIQQQSELAAEFQRTTVYADDLLMEMQGLLVQLGNVAPAEMGKALEAATNLASGLGIDLRSATMLVGKAFAGETGSLTRYGIVIDETKLKTEGVTAVLDAIGQRFGGQAQADLGTYTGQIAQMANAWDDLKERMGQLVIDAPELNTALFTINRLLQDMTRDSGAAETSVGMLWQAWEKYIEIGRIVTPGLIAWNRLLEEQAHLAEQARMAAQVPEKPLAPRPLGNLSADGMKIFDEEVKAHEKAVAAAKKAAEDHKRILAQRERDLRAFYNWLGEREMEAYQALRERLDSQQAEWREYYNWLGLRRMEDDAAALASQQAITNASSPDWLEGVWVPLKDAAWREAPAVGLTIGEGMLSGIGDVLRGGIGATLARAFEGGGGVSGAMRSVGAQIADSITQSLRVRLQERFPDIAQRSAAAVGVGAGGAALIGGAFGGGTAAMIGQIAGSIGGLALASTGAITSTVALGAATMGIGAAAVGVYMLVKAFTSVPKEVKLAREALEKFNEELAENATAAQLAESRGEAWALSIIMTRDALIDMGRSAAEADAMAQQLVKNLLNTDDPARSAAAGRAISQIVNASIQARRSAATLFEDIVEWAGANGPVPRAVRETIDEFIALGLLTDEQAAKLRGLATSSEVDLQKVTEASELFGGRLDQLGPAFQQARLDETARKYVNAIQTLLDAGQTMGAVLFDAKEELGELAAESLRTGTLLPANMKPWIQNLFDTGQLLDAQGNKIEDISGIKYGAAMKTEAEIAEEGWRNILDAIRELIAEIRGPLMAAVDGLPASRTIQVGVEYVDPGHAGDGAPGFSSGTFGRYGSWWADFGRSKMAALHNVEAVITPNQAVPFAMDVLGRGARDTSNGRPLEIKLDSRVVARANLMRTGNQWALVGG